MKHRSLISAAFMLVAIAILSSCGGGGDGSGLGDLNPTITGVSPTSGPVGTTVTITGTDLSTGSGYNVVKFNGVDANKVSSSSTQVVVIVPVGATTGPITLNVGGLVTASATFTVTTVTVPSISSFAPTSGPVGTTVTIAGSNFSTTASENLVKFNGTATNVVSSTSSQIVASVPAGATSGPVTVSVGGQLATSATTFTVTTGTVLMGGAIQGHALTLGPTVTTLAGTMAVEGTNDGTGTAARFRDGNHITTDGTYVYLADFNANTIRRITISSGLVETIAGLADTAGATDGTGTAARFDGPAGITTDGTNLYINDYRNHAVRKMELATGAVTTFVSSSQFTAAGMLSLLQDITTDGTNLYFGANAAPNSFVGKIVIASKALTKLWTASSSSVVPAGTTTDGANLYVTVYETGNMRLLSIPIATGIPTTLASGFTSPVDVTTDGTYLYVTDGMANNIKVFQKNGALVTTITAAPSFNNPGGLTTDGTSLFVGDRLNRVLRKVN